MSFPKKESGQSIIIILVVIAIILGVNWLGVSWVKQALYEQSRPTWQKDLERFYKALK